MADIFNSEQAKRLFPFIGAGVSAGAAAAPLVVAVIATDVGNDNLMLAAAGDPAALDPDGSVPPAAEDRRPAQRGGARESRGREDGRQVVAGVPGVRDEPLSAAIGLFILIYTAIQAFIYLETTELLRIYEEREQRTTILALRDAVANILAFGLGLFVTGRLVKRLGMPGTLALLPVFCALGFLILAMAPILSVLLAVDIARRAGEYGITRPAREMLFTSVDRETRFKTKPVVDVVVYRGGDAWWGGIFAYLSDGVGLGFAALSLVGAAFAGVWVASAVYLGRAFQRKERSLDAAEAQAPPRARPPSRSSGPSRSRACRSDAALAAEDAERGLPRGILVAGRARVPVEAQPRRHGRVDHHAALVAGAAAPRAAS